MRELEYPFDGQLLMRKRRSLKRALLEKGSLIEKRIAILGGSTTRDIRDLLELFLLNYGIRPVFYESDYAQYWQDAMFGAPEPDGRAPDIIFIHTSNRNITEWPRPEDTAGQCEERLEKQFAHFTVMWQKLSERYGSPIIQNNFEYPFYRLMGNMDASDHRGRVNFVTRLNLKFADYAREHEGFYINDINYQSADFGLKEWSDPFYWHMYKYALSTDAIPTLAFNVANIIKSIFGKNKKALALDLDNTLWGGVVGEDGPESIEIGQDTPGGQVYSEFQQYLKDLKDRGILLNVISKNDPDNAEAGLRHPQSVLKPEDFIEICANWEPKSANLIRMADKLSLLPESFVFVDDNPAEREIIRRQVPGAGVPEVEKPEQFITAIDRAGYFETTTLSKDDLQRVRMYRQNLERQSLMESFSDYRDYLLSLEMKAEIRPFSPVYMARIAQLTNKTNQFNLTTERYSQEEIERIAADDSFITLYGKLTDRFGDNGVVALTIGKVSGTTLDITLWLMSCRVLKRDMEYAMMDELLLECGRRGITTVNGSYRPTAKNAMVKDFYGEMGFTKVSEDSEGNTLWTLDLTKEYEPKNQTITIIREDENDAG